MYEHEIKKVVQDCLGIYPDDLFCCMQNIFYIIGVKVFNEVAPQFCSKNSTIVDALVMANYSLHVVLEFEENQPIKNSEAEAIVKAYNSLGIIHKYLVDHYDEVHPNIRECYSKDHLNRVCEACRGLVANYSIALEEYEYVAIEDLSVIENLLQYFNSLLVNIFGENIALALVSKLTETVELLDVNFMVWYQEAMTNPKKPTIN